MKVDEVLCRERASTKWSGRRDFGSCERTTEALLSSLGLTF
jgi:hypothetical protein